MNIGERIEVEMMMPIAKLDKITNLVPVKYCDDGDKQWYEVVDPIKTDFVALIGEDIEGNENIVIINRESENLGLLLDLF